MANKEKHEYPIKVGSTTYTIRFSNAGHREAEDFLGMDGDTLQMRVGQLRLGSRIRTALMWGGTRKYHREALPDVDSVDDLMDELEEQFEDDKNPERVEDDYFVPLLAAYLRADPEDIKDLFRRARGEAPKGKAKEEKKDQDKPKGKPKPKAVKDKEDAA